MKIVKTLIIFISALTIQNVYAVDRCTKLFNSWSILNSLIHSYRDSRVATLKPGMPMHESNYLIKGKLGQSTSEVFLGFDPKSGKSVVIKFNPKVHMFWRELMITEYMLNNGEVVPKILNAYIHENGMAVMIREYFKGITGEEYERAWMDAPQFENFPIQFKNEFWDLLIAEKNRLDNLFLSGDEERPSYRIWLKQNLPTLKEKYKKIWSKVKRETENDPQFSYVLEHVLYAKDFHIGNILYDIERNRWIVFDP